MTNNSTKSRSEHKLYFHKMGIPCNEDQIFTSAYSTAIYIAQILKLPSHRNKVFVLGERGIEVELDALGIPHIGGSDSKFDRDMKPEDFDDIASEKTIDASVGAVVVGMDMKVNYLKLSYAAHYLRRDAVFLATNTDSTYPTAGTVFPGAGCISATLVPMVGVAPLSLGKPSHSMIQAIQSRYNLDLERCCMIGDRLDTDIKLGIDGKLGGTLLVLTGVSQVESQGGQTGSFTVCIYRDAVRSLHSIVL